MAQTTPNQILHYTASAANYPGWAIRVGNFAVSDVGNNVSGSWGTFRMGLNPKSFTFNADRGQYGINGFAKQTYAVYFYKPSINNCHGPACYLIDDEKKIPNTNEDYPGGVSTTNPWYHLVKFTQYLGASSSLVGNYNDSMTDDISTHVDRVNNTLRWYRDQLSLGDARTYEGGTAGNRVVVNKFYPPIIANTASRIFDSSYVASLPWAPGSVTSGSKIYNLSGLTHGVFASNETLQYWDYEGGYTKPIGGLTLFDIPQDSGFALSGNAQEPSFWTLNMYVMMTDAGTNYDQFLIKAGDNVDDIGGICAGIGFKKHFIQPSGPWIYELTLSIRLEGGGTRNDYTIVGSDFYLNQWYYITVVRDESQDYKFYLNGKYVGTSNYIGAFLQSHGSGSGLTASVLHAGPASTSNENEYKNIQYLSYYPVRYEAPAVRENFLRYALNSKIRNSNILIALDTGTKACHRSNFGWVDISSYEHNATSPSFNWTDYKPAWTQAQGQITNTLTLQKFGLEPFCLSIWVWINPEGNHMIFHKIGEDYTFEVFYDNQNTQLEVEIIQNTSPNYTFRTLNSLNGHTDQWINIFVTGNGLTDFKTFIFKNGFENEYTATWQNNGTFNTPVGINDGNIEFNPDATKSKIASIIYWNSRFSKELCHEFQSIQKGRFGYDTWPDRIAATGSCDINL